MKRNYRYPGAPSFQKEDQHIFFGRDQEQAELLRLIRLEQMTVLYGKSGLGKTSLLNAGVLPQLEAYGREEDEPTYDCLKIRFFAWKDENSQSPLATLRKETVENQTLHPLLQQLDLDSTDLWYGFKNRQLSSEEGSVFTLVFDQFEELFTYPEEQVKAFKEALSQLIHANLPSAFRKALRSNTKLSRADKTALLQAIPIKVVMSIRSDRLSLMDKLTDLLPNALVNLYELKPLSRTQAAATIVEPAQKEGSFDTPPFIYTSGALNAMLTQLEDDQGQIEPFQIQYLCEHAEQVVQKTGSTTLTKEELGDFSQLFSNYYNNKIAEVGNPTEQKKARKLLEDGLLFQNVRLSVLERQVTDRKGFNVPLPIVQELENIRLIRAERREDQTFYEITHDTLVAPILESKNERKRKERRRRLIGIGIITALLLLGAIAAIVYVIDLYNEARQNEKEAKDNEALAIRNQEIADSTLAEIEIINDSLLATQLELDTALLDAIKANNKVLSENERFRKSYSPYLLSEAKKAFEVDDVRLALRLAQESLKYYSENNSTKIFIGKTISSMAKIFESNNIFLYNENGRYLAFYSDLQKYVGTLNILEIESNKKQYFNGSSFSGYYFNWYDKNGKYITFFTNIKDDEGTLNILELKNGKQQYFEHIKIKSYSYSGGGKYLTFSSDVQEDKETLNILELKSGNKQSFYKTYRKSINYSRDGKYITFSTAAKDSTRTLILLNLESNTKQVFDNCFSTGFYNEKENQRSKYLTYYTFDQDSNKVITLFELERGVMKSYNIGKQHNYHYNIDEKYIYYFTDVQDNTGTLNLLELETNEKQSFENLYLNKSVLDGYQYSKDRKYIYYFTDVQDNTGTLNLLELETGKRLGFENSYYVWDDYRYRRYEKYLVFFTDIKDNIGTLNLLELETNKKLSLNNVYHDEDKFKIRYSLGNDEKYIIFFKNVKDDIGALNVLELKSGKRQSFEVNYQANYRKIEDGKYITFFTNVMGDIRTLHVLELETGEKFDFTNCDASTLKYSEDEKYLSFCTNTQNDKPTLTLLELETGRKLSFDNFKYDSECYNEDGKYFSFYTNIQDNVGTLTIVELETGRKLSFENSYYDWNLFNFDNNYYSYYSEDGKYLSFYTNVQDNTATLNMLELKTGRKQSFENIHLEIHYYHKNHIYSIDGKYVLLIKDNSKTLQLLELETFQIIRTLNCQFEISKAQFTNDSRFVLIYSDYPGSNPNGVLKIIPTHLKDEDVFEYYDKLYPPLSAEEKRQYGLE
ncbi:MAG: ATP-binding protein [Bacteroidota bacterium]